VSEKCETGCSMENVGEKVGADEGEV